MSWTLQGKVAFITGAARGIGAGVARRLAARGVRVALSGLEADRLAALANELGQGHVWFECDVTSQQALDAAVAHVTRELGRIDRLLVELVPHHADQIVRTRKAPRVRRQDALGAALH